jgi:hypothetical protein
MQFFRNGFEINQRDAYDDRGILRDGVVARTAMNARDSTSQVRIVDGYGNDGLALCRPGFRNLTSDHGKLIHDTRLEANRQYRDRMSNAWRNDADDDEKPCPQCEGTGEIGASACERCRGEGFIPTAMAHDA